jgi:hypothetical protein
VPVAADDEDGDGDDDDGDSSASWLHSFLLLPQQFLRRRRPLVAWLLYKNCLRAGGLPSRTAVFLLEASGRTRRTTGKNMNVKKKKKKKKDFFPICAWFPICSHYVPPLSSQWFPSASQFVPKVPNVVPKLFATAPHFYPICFGKCCPPFTLALCGPKGRNSIPQNRTF